MGMTTDDIHEFYEKKILNDEVEMLREERRKIQEIFETMYCQKLEPSVPSTFSVERITNGWIIRDPIKGPRHVSDDKELILAIASDLNLPVWFADPMAGPHDIPQPHTCTKFEYRRIPCFEDKDGCFVVHMVQVCVECGKRKE